MIDKILNKTISLDDLATIFGTYDTPIYYEWRNFYRLNKKLNPDGFSNGRVNHIWIQRMICDLSNNFMKYGGQGNGKSDCTIGNKRVETKAWQLGKEQFHSAASGFFASNCKVPQYRKLMEEDVDKAKSFVFEHSYDKNDFYLLTGTAKLECKFNEIEIILVDKQKVIDCLESNYIKCNINKVKSLIKEDNDGQ